MKENSLNNAAKIGKFAGVSWGVIKQRDFSMVSYPQIDKEYYHSKVMEIDRYNPSLIKDITINLENNLKLVSGGNFESIENLELNFYYRNPKKNEYILLHTEKIKKVFQAGVREDIHVKITNPPKDLILDSYLRRGEFIVSEVKDFFIPKLGIKYSTLLKSVKNKTVAIYRTTPLENELSYVAISEKGEGFNEVLKKIYDDKYTVKDQKLVQVEQFVSNLRRFKYLRELKGVDKEGQWFVMTNKLKKHYLKHQFTKGDSITLSYITGDELANRLEESVFAKAKKIFSGPSYKQYILGNISRNSSLEFLVTPQKKSGVRLTVQQGDFRFAPPSCRNCSGGNWGVYARFDMNSFTPYSIGFKYHNFDQIFKTLNVYINNSLLDLPKLVSSGNAVIEMIDSSIGQYIKFKLVNLDKLNIIKSGSESVAILRVNSFLLGQEAVGLKITHTEGHNIDPIHHAGLIAFQQAGRRKIPIATTGWNFDLWQQKVPWGTRMPDGYIATKGGVQTFFDGVGVGVVSTITNNFD